MKPSEHPCATNFSVWPLDADGHEAASVSEFRAENAGDAFQQAMETLSVAACPDVAGWKAVRHDLRPPEDTCDCEVTVDPDWAKWQLGCGHVATGRKDAIPGESVLYCADCVRDVQVTEIVGARLSSPL